MKKCICQSCGMPIYSDELHGTGENGFLVEDYCVHCYKDGEFTEDVTMNEMIHLCARYVSGNSRDVAIVNMKLQYPRLKRWARKEETQHEYHKSISRVLEYIQGHLHENTNLKVLAAVANISPFHFHRIFKTTIGESLAGYVQRLRLEYVAEQTGYSSEQALSRAFKKYFTLPPTVFKSSFFKDKFQGELIPRICKVAVKYIIVLRDVQAGLSGWQRLYMYSMVNQLLSETIESLEIIDRGIYRPCISTSELRSPDKHIDSITLPDGLYAIFIHRGNLAGVPELFDAIQNYWMPKSKYTLLAASVPYVKYLNNPAMTAEADLLTEVYVPVIRK